MLNSLVQCFSNCELRSPGEPYTLYYRETIKYVHISFIILILKCVYEEKSHIIINLMRVFNMCSVKINSILVYFRREKNALLFISKMLMIEKKFLEAIIIFY